MNKVQNYIKSNVRAIQMSEIVYKRELSGPEIKNFITPQLNQKTLYTLLSPC